MREADPRKGAFIIIKSAEGKRTAGHKYISPEEWERQRDILEKAGIKRIRSAVYWLMKKTRPF